MEISISLEVETINGVPYDPTHNLYSVNNKRSTIDVYNFLNEGLNFVLTIKKFNEKYWMKKLMIFTDVSN